MNRLAQERLARVDALEAYYAGRIRLALTRQVELSIAALEQGASPAMAAAYVSAAALKPVLEALWTRVITREARYQYWALVGEKKARADGPELTWLQRAKQFAQTEGSKAIQQITATSRKLVRGVIQDAIEAGKSIPEVAKALRQQVTSFSRQRATTIARTELLTAANYGSYCGAATSGLALDKYWIATRDGRTRSSHAACAGEAVDVQGVFLVGGYVAAYPGDPMLPAAERIRCRCTVGYRPKQKR